MTNANNLLLRFLPLFLFSITIQLQYGCGSAANELQSPSITETTNSNAAITDDEEFPLSGETITNFSVDATPQHLWSINSGNDDWGIVKATLSNNGNDVVTMHTPPFVPYQPQFSKLLTGYSAAPTIGIPTQLWQVPLAAYSYILKSASTAKTTMLLIETREGYSGVRHVYLQRYQTPQTTPTVYEFPNAYVNAIPSPTAWGMEMTPDGNNVIVWLGKNADSNLFVFRDGAMTNPRVETFSNATGKYMMGDILKAALTPDGKILVMQSSLKTYAENVITGQQLYFGTNWNNSPAGRIAISNDGRLFVRSVDMYDQATATFYPGIQTYFLQNGSYVIAPTVFKAFTLGQINAMALSGDGNSLIYVVAISAQPGSAMKNQIRILNLATTPYSLAYDEALPSESTAVMMNLAMDIDITKDGHLGVVGMTGDSLNQEVLAFQRTNNGVYNKFFTYNLAGSVNSVDLNDDGRLVVASRGEHYLQADGAHDSIDLFDLEPSTPPVGGESDLAVSGTPLPGQTVTLKMTGGTPNKLAYFLMAPALANPPVLYGNQQGLLYLNPYMLSLLGRGHFDASGVATITISIPNSVPHGSTWYIQANKERLAFSSNYLTFAF